MSITNRNAANGSIANINYGNNDAMTKTTTTTITNSDLSQVTDLSLVNLQISNKTKVNGTANASIVDGYDGALVVQGGAVIAKDLYVQGALYSTSAGGTQTAITLSDKLTTPRIEASGNLTIVPNASASGGKVITNGQVSITDGTGSTSTTTGALTVTGGIGIGGAVVSNSVTSGDVTVSGTLVSKTRHFRSLDLSTLASNATTTVYLKTTGSSPNLNLVNHVGYAWLTLYEKYTTDLLAGTSTNWAYACALVQVYPYKTVVGSSISLLYGDPRIRCVWLVEQRNLDLTFAAYDESATAPASCQSFTIQNTTGRACGLNVSLAFIGGPQPLPFSGGSFAAAAATIADEELAIDETAELVPSKRQASAQGGRSGKRSKQ